MKRRTAFVSNSSSSSFIVGFDHIPETKDELKKMMFPEGAIKVPGTDVEVVLYDCQLMTVDQVAERIFSDIKNAKVIEDKYKRFSSNSYILKNDEQVVDDICLGHFEGAPWFNDEEFRERDKIENECWSSRKCSIYSLPVDDPMRIEYLKIVEQDSERFDKALREAAEKLWENRKESFKNKVIISFEYADEDGDALLEHGNIFEHLPHIIISKH